MMEKSKRIGKIKYWFLRIAMTLCLVNLVAMTCIEFYTKEYYSADDSVMDYINNPKEGISVSFDEDRVVFMPENPVAGVIFYPGALVEYTAYVPLMERLAENDIAAIDLRMNHNMAVLSRNAADGIEEEFPQISRWYMAGHSLGGAMAGTYVSKHGDEFDGLILLASFSPKPIDEKVDVLSIRGSNDEVLKMKSYNEYMEKDTPHAVEVVIDGGIHSYFGAYGPQQDDGKPEITAEEQLDITIENINGFIK